MGFIKGDEIRGYRFDQGQIVCRECARGEDLKDVVEEDVLTDHEVDGDDLWFCDRCKKQL